MEPVDVVTYASLALPAAITSVVGLLVLRSVYQRAMSVLTSCLLVIAAAAVGTVLSYELMNAFSYLLHGDGALGLVFVPMAGGALAVLVGAILGVVLAVTGSRQRARRGDV